MENEQLFKFMEKMYSEMQQGFSKVNERLDVAEKTQGELKADIQKLSVKVEGEITEKLKILSEEQSIMRKDILDIKYQQVADKQILLDIKLSTDTLNSNQKKQENKIIELDKKIAK